MKYDVDEFFEILSEILNQEKNDIRAIEPDADLEFHGLESIEAIKLIIALENRYQIEFKDEDLIFGKYNTLNKLFGLLNDYLCD